MTLRNTVLPLALAVGTMSASQMACLNPVHSFVNGTKMAQSDFSANVTFAKAGIQKTSIGYGSSQDRENETTIVDGTVYLAHPDGNNHIVLRTKPEPEEGATMLQVATPDDWSKGQDVEGIGSLEDLAFIFDDMADDMECHGKARWPFKMTGHAKKITWSMDTLPKHLVTTAHDQPVTVVGIYDTATRKKTFMVKGSNLHAHVLMPNIHAAGHVREIEFVGKAHLFLPIYK